MKDPVAGLANREMTLLGKMTLFYVTICVSKIAYIQANEPNQIDSKEIGHFVDIVQALAQHHQIYGVHMIGDELERVGLLKELMKKYDISTMLSSILEFDLILPKCNTYVDVNHFNASEVAAFFNRNPEHAKAESWFFIGTEENLAKLSSNIQVMLNQRVYLVSGTTGKVNEYYSLKKETVSRFVGSVLKTDGCTKLTYKENSNVHSFLERRSNLLGVTLQGFVSSFSPFLHIPKNFRVKIGAMKDGWIKLPNGSGEFMDIRYGDIDGLNMDVLKSLETSMNFTSQLLHARRYNEPTFGRKLKDGSWNGYIGNLMRGDGDFFLAPLTLNPVRHEAIDFLLPIGETNLAFYIPPHGFDIKEWNSFFYPLRPSTWAFLVLNSIFLVIFLKLLHLYNFQGKIGNFSTEILETFGNFWMFLMSYIGKAPSVTYPNNVYGIRVLFLVVFLAGNIVSMSYRASLTAALSVQEVSRPFQSIDELIDSPYRVIYIRGIDHYISALLASPNRVTKWVELANKKMTPKKEENVQRTVQHGINTILAAKEPTTLLVFREHVAIWAKDRCLVTEAYNNEFPIQNSIAFAKGSPYTSVMNYQVLKLWENGAMDVFKKAHLTVKNNCNNGNLEEKSLSAKKLTSLFAIVLFGMALSVMVLMTERIFEHGHYFWSSNCDQSAGKDMLKDAYAMKCQRDRYLDKKEALHRLMEEIGVKDTQMLMRRLDDILESQFSDDHI